MVQVAATDLAPGDVLVLYTDGVTEAANPAGELFGEARLMQVIAAHARGPAAELLRAITAALEAFIGEAEPADDVTCGVVRRG